MGDHRAPRLQQAVHAHRAVARARRRDQPADDVRDALAGKPDHALRAAQRRRGRRRRSAGGRPLRREHPEPARRPEGHQGHHQPARGRRLLLAEQSRGALAPSGITGSRARRSTWRSTPTAWTSATGCSVRTTSRTRFTIGDEVIADRRRRHQDADRAPQRRGRQDHADLDGQEQHPDQQRHLHRR